jgi:hypothetical protein
VSWSRLFFFFFIIYHRFLQPKKEKKKKKNSQLTLPPPNTESSLPMREPSRLRPWCKSGPWRRRQRMCRGVCGRPASTQQRAQLGRAWRRCVRTDAVRPIDSQTTQPPFSAFASHSLYTDVHFFIVPFKKKPQRMAKLSPPPSDDGAGAPQSPDQASPPGQASKKP